MDSILQTQQLLEKTRTRNPSLYPRVQTHLHSLVKKRDKRVTAAATALRSECLHGP